SRARLRTGFMTDRTAPTSSDVSVAIEPLRCRGFNLRERFEDTLPNVRPAHPRRPLEASCFADRREEDVGSRFSRTLRFDRTLTAVPHCLHDGPNRSPPCASG